MKLYTAIVCFILGLASLCVDAQTPLLTLSEKFPRGKAPGTGRETVQLTSGEAACYPLYYFTPSISRNGKFLVYHRYEKKNVQLWRLNLATAENVQLTHATGTNTDWHPWQREAGLGGVMDYRATLNVARNLLVYFDGRQARAIELESLREQPLFELPAGREAIGQNTTTPDGQWLLYIDAPAGAEYQKPCVGAKLMAYNFDTHEQQMVFNVDNAIHHVLAYDNSHFIVNHPPGHNGIMWTALGSGQWCELRWGDPGVVGHACHQLPTARGISYEVFGAGRCVVSGLYDPFARRRFEFFLPKEFAYTHTGWDREGRLWFWETTGRAGHSLWVLEKMDRVAGGRFKPLTGHWPLVAAGQRGHFHPQLTPDRRWVLMTGGDDNQCAQVFLLNVADVPDTEGLDASLLSATGANDVRVPGQLIGAPAIEMERVKLGGDALATVEFNSGQSYAGEAYRYLGDGAIELTLPVAPKPGQILELRWGAKNDDRQATLTMNGKQFPLRSGGYNGYRWLGVPVPAAIGGEKYEIKLEAPEKGKAAFVSAVRVQEKAKGK